MVTTSFPRGAASGASRRLGLLLALAIVGGSACRPDDPAKDAGAGAASPTARDYVARGLVVGQTGDGREWLIHHEAIADFVGVDGRPAPMDAMTMPFPIDKTVAGNLRKGDRIRFHFRVDWEGSPPLAVRKVEVLEPEIRLSFEEVPAVPP